VWVVCCYPVFFIYNSLNAGLSMSTFVPFICILSLLIFYLVLLLCLRWTCKYTIEEYSTHLDLTEMNRGIVLKII
jgi:hypothetical protein